MKKRGKEEEEKAREERIGKREPSERKGGREKGGAERAGRTLPRQAARPHLMLRRMESRGCR